MMRLTLEQKALRVIDWMVSDDLSENVCMKRGFDRSFTQEDSQAMADKLGSIYTISHSAIPEHLCYKVHDDWRETTLLLFKKLNESPSGVEEK